MTHLILHSWLALPVMSGKRLARDTLGTSQLAGFTSREQKRLAHGTFGTSQLAGFTSHEQKEVGS